MDKGVGTNDVPLPPPVLEVPPPAEPVFELEVEGLVSEPIPADRVGDKLSGKLGVPPPDLPRLMFPAVKSGRPEGFTVVFPPEELGLEK